MWKENRFAYLEAKSEEPGKGGKRPDVPQSARLEPGAKPDDVKADAERAAADARADELLARMDAEEAAKNAVTPAGLLARIGALEADKKVSSLATKEWRALISSPDFKPGSDASKRVIAKVEELERESAKVTPVVPKDGIDVDKLQKVDNDELDKVLAAIPDKMEVGAKDPLADYQEFFKKEATPVTAPGSNGVAVQASENEISEESLKRQHIAGIETTHNATGKAIADLEARVAQARQSFRDAMSSPEGRKDLMLRVKEADFKNIEDALQALKANYDSEAMALSIIKNSSSERFDVNVNAFVDLNSSIQKGLDTVITQLSAFTEASNEIAKKLEQKAQDQAESEARIAAQEEFEQKEAVRLAEEKVLAEAAKFKIELGTEEDFDATSVPAKAVVESDLMAGLRLNEPGMGHIILIKIKETAEKIGKLREEIAKLQKENSNEGLDDKRNELATLNKVLAAQKKEFADMQKPAKTIVDRDKYVAEMAAQGVPESLRSDRTIGNQLVRWKGRLDGIDNPVTIKTLGPEFAQFTEKAREFLEKDGSFGLYIAQLDTLISRSAELKKANPDLGELIDRYRKAVIDAVIAESKNENAPSLEGSKLEEVGREFTRLALTIDELTKLKGKVGSDDYNALRSSLLTNTAEGQKNINEKYTRIYCHEKLAEYADKGYISKDLSERYASSDDWIQLALALRLVEEKLPEFKAAKEALMGAVNAGYINDDEAKRIASATITDTAYLTDRANYHSPRIAAIKALEEKVMDNPDATGTHLDINALKKAAYVEYTDAEKLKKAVEANPTNPDALVMIELAKKAELGAFRKGMEEATKDLKPETKITESYAGLNADKVKAKDAPAESMGIDNYLVNTHDAVAKIKAQEEADRLARTAEDTPIDLKAATARFQAGLAKAPEVKPPTEKEKEFDKELEAMLIAARENPQTAVAQSPEKATVDPVLQEAADKMHLNYNEAVAALGKIEDSSSTEYQVALDKMRLAAIDYALAEGKVRTNDKNALGDAVTKILTEQSLVKADAFIYGENEAELKTFAITAIQDKAKEDAERIAANTMDFETIEVEEEKAPPVAAPTPAPPVAGKNPPEATPSS